MTWFAHCLRQQYERNLIDGGYCPESARQIARDTKIRVLSGRCQALPPTDPAARHCIEVADQQLNHIYML